MADKSRKKSRKAITLHSKIKIIKLGEEGVKQSEIGRRLGLPRTTVNSVIKNKQKILAEVKSSTPMNTTVIRKRDSLVADMERFLMVWIDNQTSRHVPLTQAMIQNKAQCIFNDIKAKKGEAAKDAKFGASRGWFDRFKRRSNLHNIKPQEDATSSDTVDSERLSQQDIGKIIDDDPYVKDQVFNADETGVYWKKIPTRTFIARKEKVIPDVKPAKDRPTLLLEANASSTFKNEDLVALEEPRHEGVPEEPKGLTCEVLIQAFRCFEAGMALLKKHDPDFERSSKVNANIVKAYACYREIYRKKIKESSSQTTLDMYFQKRPALSASNKRSRRASSTQSPASSAPSRRTSRPPTRKCLALNNSTYDVDDTRPCPLDFLQCNIYVGDK